MNYLTIKSVASKDFARLEEAYDQQLEMLQADEREVSKIEKVLALQPGTLAGKRLLLERVECVCGRTLTFYDFVFTALIQQWHNASFIVHTLLGNKHIINERRVLMCSSCLEETTGENGEKYSVHYAGDKYGCSGWNPDDPGDVFIDLKSQDNG